MSSVNSVAIESERPAPNGLVKRRYSLVLTKNDGSTQTFLTRPIVQSPEENGDTVAAEQLRALQEADRARGITDPDWGTVDPSYIKQAVIEAMRINDVMRFLDYIPIWDQLETLGGNNATQRSKWLGVTRDSYLEAETRFNIAKTLKAQIEEVISSTWGSIPEDFR